MMSSCWIQQRKQIGWKISNYPVFFEKNGPPGRVEGNPCVLAFPWNPILNERNLIPDNH